MNADPLNSVLLSLLPPHFRRRTGSIALPEERTGRCVFHEATGRVLAFGSAVRRARIDGGQTQDSDWLPDASKGRMRWRQPAEVFVWRRPDPGKAAKNRASGLKAGVLALPRSG